MGKNPNEEPPAPGKALEGKHWIGGYIDAGLYAQILKIAEADMVPVTVVMRWALADYVAGRSGS